MNNWQSLDEAPKWLLERIQEIRQPFVGELRYKFITGNPNGKVYVVCFFGAAGTGPKAWLRLPDDD